MSWPGICDVQRQDCAILYPSIVPPLKSGSCVPDGNRGGGAGTCGWVGSRCSSTQEGESNCQDGSDLPGKHTPMHLHDHHFI